MSIVEIAKRSNVCWLQVMEPFVNGDMMGTKKAFFEIQKRKNQWEEDIGKKMKINEKISKPISTGQLKKATA